MVSLDTFRGNLKAPGWITYRGMYTLYRMREDLRALDNGVRSDWRWIAGRADADADRANALTPRGRAARAHRLPAWENSATIQAFFPYSQSNGCAVPKSDPRPLSKRDFETLADFRYQIRKFVRFSEQLALRHGLKPQQYLLLLQIRGYPGRDWATVGELAERLQAQHHGVVALISRCEKLGLVERRRSEEDRRQIEVRLLRKGDKLLN